MIVEKGLWALVLRVRVYNDACEPRLVKIGADRNVLYDEGQAWMGEDVHHRDFDVVPVSIDWPSLDPQEAICAKSAV